MLIAFAALLVDHVVIVNTLWYVHEMVNIIQSLYRTYDSLSDVGEIRVYQRADFQSGSRVLKKVF